MLQHLKCYATVLKRQHTTLWRMMAKGKQGAERALVRRMRIIHRLPGGEKTDTGMTIRELLAYLALDGIECGIRTVERDLEAIHEVGSVWRHRASN